MDSLGDAKDLSFVPAKYGAPWLLSHRVDLHNELKLLALGPPTDGAPAELHLKSAVAAIVCGSALSMHILPFAVSIIVYSYVEEIGS